MALKSFEEYTEVASLISTVLIGFDPVSREFTEPRVVVQQNIDAMIQIMREVNDELRVAQSTLTPDNPLSQLINEMREGLAAIPVKIIPTNVDLVRAYYSEIVMVAK